MHRPPSNHVTNINLFNFYNDKVKQAQRLSQLSGKLRQRDLRDSNFYNKMKSVL